MGFKLPIAKFTILQLAAVVVFSGCLSGPYFYLQYGDDYRAVALDQILADNPLPPGENIKVASLGRSATASQHVVQIRDREILHVHKLHDATATLLRGQGQLIFGKNQINLKAGDVIHIPRGVEHQFINAANDPAVVLAIYSPPFDGKDTHPVNRQ